MEFENSNVVVLSITGATVLEVSPKPSSVGQLKEELERASGTPAAFQKLLIGEEPLHDGDLFGPESLEVVLAVDEITPVISWDILGNPNASYLDGAEGVVRFISDADTDYVNVITQHPVSDGSHFFEFVMHRIGDEQWCGITPFRERAGHRGGSVGGWFYYCGRRLSSHGELHAGRENRNFGKFDHVANGDVIGMFLDMDEGRIAFTLNGRVQGACEVPKKPMYLTTCLDVEEDHVELRKVALQDVPVSFNEFRSLPLMNLAEGVDSDSD